MARSAIATDPFSAVAEPRRRQILDVLVNGEQPVAELVRRLGVSQPLVSKHLRVLREAGVVSAREQGRQRLYRVNGSALRSIHDWVAEYEQLWSGRFQELDLVLSELEQTEGMER